MDGTKFLGNLSAYAGINAARNSCSSEEGKDRTNGKVVPAHAMKAYVENAGTVALILNQGTSGDESSNSRTCRFSAGKERQSELEARWAPEPVRTFL